MAAPATPTNYYCQTADAKVFLSWSLTTGATSYGVQRSTDGVTYSTLASPATNSYLDEAVTVGTLYYYKVCATNDDGSSAYTTPQNTIPAPPGEVALLTARLLSQQRADMVNSNFVTLPEWNSFINLACYELYDMLIAANEDYFIADPLEFTTDGSSTGYPLPNGINYDGARAIYKLRGVDLGGSGNNGWVTVSKFNFIDRNKYYYPNSAGTLYGVVNLSYRMVGPNIQFIPAPSANQTVRLWYIPRLTQLLQDTDTTDISISGWIQYVIVRAAKYALDKEESDSSQLTTELVFLKQRIEAMAQNRDAGQPDTISDTAGQAGGYFGPSGGYQGGY